MSVVMATVGHDKVPGFRGRFIFDGHTLEATGGSLGLAQPFEPKESDLPALTALVEAIQAAIDGRSRS